MKLLIKVLKKILHFIENIFKIILSTMIFPIIKVFSKNIIKNSKTIPIYIISYNRLFYIKQMIEWLLAFGYENIIIIDNNSSNKKLLKYYETLNFKIYKMKKNYGHDVFFKHIRFFLKRNFTFYALTDPDLVPIKDCREDFMDIFLNELFNNRRVTKVGFSLIIDDIPEQYKFKELVIRWETKFYNDFVEYNNIKYYNADIDTTFAVYKPCIFWPRTSFYNATRVGYPYQLHHLPWYITSDSEENTDYLRTIRKDITNWNGNFTLDELEKKIFNSNIKNTR